MKNDNKNWYFLWEAFQDFTKKAKADAVERQKINLEKEKSRLSNIFHNNRPLPTLEEELKEKKPAYIERWVKYVSADH